MSQLKKPLVLLIDNYDSFTYNLKQYLQQLGAKVTVRKNNQLTAGEAESLKPDFLVISPGPGHPDNPEDVGMSRELMEHFRGQIPILGVCLGHQLLGKMFGGQMVQTEPKHGEVSPIKVVRSSVLFKGLEAGFVGMRYHSLVVSPPAGRSWRGANGLKVTAVTNDEDQHIMALEKPGESLYGVQFHPESIGTKEGLKILENFLQCSN